MIGKYHNHKLQTTLWHREEEPLNRIKFYKGFIHSPVSTPSAPIVVGEISALKLDMKGKTEESHGRSE